MSQIDLLDIVDLFPKDTIFDLYLEDGTAVYGYSDLESLYNDCKDAVVTQIAAVEKNRVSICFVGEFAK